MWQSPAHTCAFQSPIDVKEAIFSALSVVIQRHPILSAIPVDEASTSPYFARLPEINLEDAVTFIARKLLVSENERDFELTSSCKPNTTSLSRRTWLLAFLASDHPTNPTASNEFVASFVFHHALGDGAQG